MDFFFEGGHRSSGKVYGVVIGIVTDKEKGLVAAMKAVFPATPYQFCHTHFLKNCAKPMQPDLQRLGESVTGRAERVRVIEKDLVRHMKLANTDPLEPAEPSPVMKATPSSDSLAPVAPPAVEATPARKGSLPSASLSKPTTCTPLTEEALAREIRELVRANSRVSGKAPLGPPELARHERLNEVRALVNDALKKKTQRARAPKTGRCSVDCVER